MGRRRKTDGSGDAEVSKKARLSTEMGGVGIRWEWEADGGKWTAYADDLGSEVTDALTSGQKEVIVEPFGNVQMRVIFERMVQKNKKTGWERRLRCAVKDTDDEEYYVWEWEDEHGKWNGYGAEHSVELEKAKQTGQASVKITACHRSYTIDITSLKQKNDTTGVDRKVHRIKSDAIVPTTDVKPVVSTSKTKAASSGATTSVGSRKSSRMSGRSSAAAAVKVEPEEEEEEEEVEEVKPPVRSARAMPTTKTVVLKGKAPVDSECPKVGSSQVVSEGKIVWDAMLNQTNLSNNNNKYYLMQVLQDDNKKSYSVWFRWGRVGFKGQTNLVPCGPDLDEAKRTFMKKFTDKTKNEWPVTGTFKKISGKYDLVKMDYSSKSGAEDEVDAAKKKKVPTATLR